ncbi:MULTISPECIES: IS66 family insertion sequence element accessory protein TnpB [unclassified Pigmentiphaga]|uniref:IS66 family insertion sequence element accessory protein TnpA n=1 Tax=unclassified Pigmentiphaga TaxID=2626614 RepID=UPI001045B809|nr:MULTISPECIES: IS66 family insertion sequence element accessory protein TnpB [unclassified Pigmentiphaga]
MSKSQALEPDARQHRRTAQQWSELVSQQVASGLSVATWCAEQGLSAASLWNWKRRLHDEATGHAMGTSVGERASFIELGQTGSAVLASGIKLRLELGDGLVLELSRS